MLYGQVILKIASQIHAILLIFIAAIGIMFTWIFPAAVLPDAAHDFDFSYFTSFHFVYGNIFSFTALALGMIQWRRHSNKIWYYVLIWYVSFLITSYFYLASIAE